MAVPHELVSQLKEKYPMLHYFTERTFGVEVEFYGLDYFITPPDGGIIKPYNIHSSSSHGRRFSDLLSDRRLSLGTDKNSWHLEEDSSITHRGGAELVSPILSGIEGLMELYRYFQLLCDIEGVKIDKSCGFHVHHGVDRELYTCRHLRELVRIVFPMEDYLYLLIAGDRHSKETCRPIEFDVAAFLETWKCEDECRVNGCRIQRLWYSSQNRCDPDQAGCARYDKTRYHGLNLHSYWYRSTIEFRYHSAVLHDIDEAIQWIIFTQFLLELSHGHVPTVCFYSDANKWMKAIYRIYLVFGHMKELNWRH